MGHAMTILHTKDQPGRRSPARGGGPSRPLLTSGRILQKRASSSSCAPPGLGCRYARHTHMPKVSSCHHGRCSDPAWAFPQPFHAQGNK
eukprot:362589-Chlamydomonas_euryale.AAC.11